MIIFTFHNLLVKGIIDDYFTLLSAVWAHVNGLFEEAEVAEGMTARKY